MIQAYIIDDERLARLELRQALADFAEQITVIGEAASKAEAVAYLSSTGNPRPNVIFLDINMPQGSGFDVLEEIDYNGDESNGIPQIRVVFVTAYDEYALRAFKVNALDYLLKPIDPDRLEQTILRLERSLPALQKEPTPQKSSSKLSSDDVVFLTIGKSRRFVPLSEIVCITSNDNYSEILLQDGKRPALIRTMLLRTMNEWEEMLPEQDFIRIHRGTIINLTHLDSERPIDPSGSGAIAYLRGIEEGFAVSRRSLMKFKEQFTQSRQD